MLNEIIVKDYAPQEVDRKEIFRYSLVKGDVTEEFNKKLDNLLNMSLDKLKYKVCYSIFPLSINGDTLDMGFCEVKSKDLARTLNGADKVVVFGATIGIEIDRLINRYGKISPSDALFLQGIGAERVESLVENFCNDIKKEVSKSGLSLTPRFSPGYGDLPLTMQKDIFNALSLEKNIMLTLNESLIMSPSKSVTAIMGIKKDGGECKSGCEVCKKVDCTFRKE